MAGGGRGACEVVFKAVSAAVAGWLLTACNTGNGNPAAGAPPPVPTGLTAVAVSANQVDLSWADAGGSTAGYRIAYQAGTAAPPDCKSGTVIAQSDISGHSHSVTRLQARTTYSFAVCAVDGDAHISAVSAPASATTLTGPPDPGTPQAVVKSSSEIDLSWSGGGGTTAGYQIAYAVGAPPPDCAGGIKIITADQITGTAAAVHNLGKGVTYGFRVCAVDAAPITSVSRGTTVTASTYSLSQSTVSVAQASIPVGATDDIRLTLRDAAQRQLVLPGLNVSFHLSGTSTGSFGPVTDNGDGTYDTTFTAAATSGAASRIVATVNGESLTSIAPTVQIEAGPLDAAHSTVTLNPPSPAAILEGQTATITVTARDAAGNQETAGGGTVALTLGGDSGAATGVLGAVVDHDNGTYTATFTATGAGTPLTVAATIGGAPVAGTSPAPSIAVAPCTAATIVWTQDPNATRTAGQNFTAGRVQLQDAAGDACGVAPVTFILDTTGDPLSGSSTVTPFAAAADLTQANIQRAGTYHLIAQAGTVSSAASTAVTVNGGPATQLGFTHLPAIWHTGTANSVQAALEDQYGNVASGGAGGSVDLSLAAAPGGGALSGNTTAALSGNFATFHPVAIDADGVDYRLSASAGAFQATSDPFEVESTAGVDLQVPIELADGALSNTAGTQGSDVAYTTETSFDPAAYDGSVSVYFEIVATNTGTDAGELTLDYGCAADPVAGSDITVPAGVTAATRYRSAAVTLTAGHYCVDVPRLTAAGTLTVDAARLIVSQSGAHSTRVYVPLVSYSGIVDTGDGVDRVSKSVSDYTQPTPDRYAIWKADTSGLAGIAASGYTFEVLSQGSHDGNASVALVDRGNDAVIAAFPTGLNGVHFASASFDGNTVPQFRNGDAYEVRMRGAASSGILYKAGLWIQLEDLSAYTTYWRTNRSMESVTGPAVTAGSRQLLDTDAFSNPSLDFVCTAAVGAEDESAVLDLAAVSGPSGTSGAQSVPSSSLTITAPKGLFGATGLNTFAGSEDYFTRATTVSGTLDVTQCLAQIHGQVP